VRIRETTKFLKAPFKESPAAMLSQENIANLSRVNRSNAPTTRVLASVVLIGVGALSVLGSALRAGGVETTTSRYCTTSNGTASPEYDSNTRIYRDRMVKALDSVRNKVEEWGVVTISAPVAVLNPRAFFVPDNIVSPEAAYTGARSDVEASAVQATEVGISNQFGATVVPTIIPPVPKPPKGGTATQNTTTTTTVTSPPAGGTPPPNPNEQELPPPAALPSGTIAPLNLGTVPAPTKSVAAALREAQDNTMRQKIYTQMSYPNGIESYNVVIFAIVEVSCNPGWRTKEHYIAESQASLEYCDLCTKRPLSLSMQRAPTVFSVLPLLDAQTVEMANSQREVTQLAFQLAATLPAHGVNIRAKDLFQFVRRYSRDLRSRTPIPVVNSYSSGSTFGFRFSPSFQAMRDPAQKNARAGNVLLPTSFPALITVVMHDEDVASMVENGFVEPGILTHVSTRWFLKDRPPLWQLPKRLFAPMRRNTAEMEVSAAEDVAHFYLAKENFKEATGGNAGVFNPMYEEARRNVIALQAKGIGRDWPIPLNFAFLEAKKQADAKMHARLEQMELQNEQIEDLTKQINILKLQKEVQELRKTAGASTTDSTSVAPAPKDAKDAKAKDAAPAASADATSTPTPVTAKPNG
jgi:hypothetical protein